jgi:hypothetical protein
MLGPGGHSMPMTHRSTAVDFMKKNARPLEIIASELRSEIAGIIRKGNLLIEAKEQIAEHGTWLPWLAENFGSSESTAQNYMKAARYAIKNPTVGDLKVRPSALYWLAYQDDLCGEGDRDGDDELKEIIFREAADKWVTANRVREISREFYDAKDAAARVEAEKREAARDHDFDDEPETEEEKKAREAEGARERYRAELKEAKAAIAAKAAAILDGPPPDVPSASEAPTRDVILPPFDQAIKTLETASTKPLAKYRKTEHQPGKIRVIAEFLHSVADVIEGGK